MSKQKKVPYRLKKLTPEELESAPEIIKKIYKSVETGENISEEDKKAAFDAYRSKYYVRAKSFGSMIKRRFNVQSAMERIVRKYEIPSNDILKA